MGKKPARPRSRGPLRIHALYAYLSTDAAGDEGLCGARTATGDWIPLIGADRARIDSLRPLAESQARQSGRPVTLVRFAGRQDLEVIQP